MTMRTKEPSTLALGERIRWARKTAGLSQVNLAAMIGTSQRHIVRWETGDNKPGEVYRAKLAQATGQPESLFSENGSGDDSGEEPG